MEPNAYQRESFNRLSKLFHMAKFFSETFVTVLYFSIVFLILFIIVVGRFVANYLYIFSVYVIASASPNLHERRLPGLS